MAPTDAEVIAALATVAEVEAKVPELGAAPGQRTFRRAGKVCVAAHLLRAGVPTAWRRIRGVTEPLGLLARLPLGGRFVAPVHADIVVIKSGLRAIYGALSFTLKIAKPGDPNGADRLRAEIAARGRLRDTPEIGLPALLGWGETAAAVFLVESYVQGSRHERRLRDPAGFAARLLRFYLANGAEVRPLGDVAAEAWRRFNGAASRLGYRVPGGLEALVRGLRREDCVLWGLCHGDLSPENLFDHGGSRVTLVDWEYAREDPVFTDVAKLAVGNEAFRRAFLAAAGTVVGEMLEPAAQLALGGMIAINRRAEALEASGDRPAERDRFRRKAERLAGVIDLALAQAGPSGRSSAR